ncbi:MAG: hypothetical protein M3357_18655 [Actinomycetota bacterium]|nr:hypothetical protein [Actinomycetota bacterium]
MPRSAWRRFSAVLLAVVGLAARAPVASQAAGADSGYWVVDAKGNVYEFGGAPFKGSAATDSRIVAMVPTPSGQGYWLAAADGSVFPLGDASSRGSLGGLRLNQPIVGMAATPSGGGYWLVAADGGIFSFGDAPFNGSLGGLRLNQPIVGMAATPSGGGYWLVAADGGIFGFGDAPFKGSLGGQRLNRPIVAMATTPSGNGYWLVASDGGVFTFNAPFFGSGGASMIDAPIVGMAAVPDGSGYWMADASGDVYNFGGARYSGEADDCPLPAGIVGLAASGPGTALSPPPARPNCGLSSTTTTTTPASGGGSSFQIGLIGDTGYTADQESLFRRARSHMNTYPLAFVVHDGDFKSGGSSCTDSKFRSARDTFNGFEAPFIFTPGDNEWKDCSDPIGRLKFLRSLFFSTSESLGQNRITLTRQSGYPENARWVQGNVVFATLNLPGSDGRSSSSSETSARITADVAWLNAAFDQAEQRGSPGVMIAWQDNPFRTGEPKTLATLKSRTRSFGKPVVLVHGDTHSFQIDRPWSDVENFTRVETYATTQSDRWVLATVNPSSPSVFSFSSKTAP